ncbi:YtxH domain-containing protein [Lactobacillus sp. PV012]|uniref:YtxH domain-containing protein n=1 Tax=Lactobacillus sp. PV012 TaxID=2594494 RepID=UPI00223F47E2|nr:YtxH domain-containing protein [Lactobacillus sp. PV012]
MFPFLLGVVSGGLVGAAASFVKNPSTDEPIREDIRKHAEELKESCAAVKNNYQ